MSIYQKFIPYITKHPVLFFGIPFVSAMLIGTHFLSEILKPSMENKLNVDPTTKAVVGVRRPLDTSLESELHSLYSKQPDINDYEMVKINPNT